MAHASWRGTAGGIAERLVESLTECFGVDPVDLVACIAPSAGPCCYEVGAEVRDAAAAGIGAGAGAFFIEREGRLYFDLWEANAEQLRGEGVPDANMHVAGVCTICRSDLFPSVRAEGDGAGRFAAVIGRR
jgi:copper oxidase (laccase) domain-containing protein